MLSDLRFAFRSLLQAPGFTVVALLTLALGLGMNTAMFSMLNGFLLRPLNYPQPEQLFRLDHVTAQRSEGNHAVANILDLIPASAGFADLAAYRYWGFTLTEPDHPAEVPFALRVTANYFSVLGFPPEAGRNFRPDEDVDGKNNVLIISHRYWQARFGGEKDVVGRTVRIDGTPCQIVGILPARDDAARLTGLADFYRPIAFSAAERPNRVADDVAVIGRLHDDITRDQANARFAAVARQLASGHPAENGNMQLRVRSLQSTALSGVGRVITLLLIGLSAFVLLIACGNLANLLLARAISRGREFSIRGALGASTARLVRPLVAECLLLAAAGGLAATFVSLWTTGWLGSRFGSPGNPADFSVDGRVVVFTVSLALLTAMLFGVGPAWWAARVNINEALKNGTRGTTGSRVQQRYRQVLLAVQFALAVVLLAGAGFFIQGIHRLTHVQSGWRPASMVTGSVNLASARYHSAVPILAFHDQLRERLLAVPGVANVAVSYEEPLFDSPARRRYRVEGREAPPAGQEPLADTNGVSASYFDTVGTRILRGRGFDGTDTTTSRPVVIINETMARTLFPQGDALGHRLAVFGDASPNPWAEIVGIAEDVHPQRVQPSPVVFQVYKPFAQEAWQYVSILVRATDAARVPSLLEPIRRVVAALDPDQPVNNLLPTPIKIERNVSTWHTVDQLLILFAGLGLLLSALGIYGVTARLVALRTPEIGLRMALGAQVRDVARLIVGGGLRTALAGSLVGLLGAAWLSIYLARALPVFGGEALLPIAAAITILLTVAVLACWLPARRASRIDPAVALRAE